MNEETQSPHVVKFKFPNKSSPCQWKILISIGFISQKLLSTFGCLEISECLRILLAAFIGGEYSLVKDNH